MLTEKEKKWLEFRKYRKAPCGDETHRCVGCMVKCGCWMNAMEVRHVLRNKEEY